MAMRNLGILRSVNTISSERRCEPRVGSGCMCSYEVLEMCDEELAATERGEAYVVNSSTRGMLLFLGQPLQRKQLIRVSIARSGWERIGDVFEARWNKPIQMESLGNLYLVGCRRTAPSFACDGLSGSSITLRPKAHCFS